MNAKPDFLFDVHIKSLHIMTLNRKHTKTLENTRKHTKTHENTFHKQKYFIHSLFLLIK